MLTGDQIRAARQLAGFRSQAAFASAAGVSRPTVERAEAAGEAIPAMATAALVRMVRALEEAGISFGLHGGSLIGGLAISLQRRGASRSGQ